MTTTPSLWRDLQQVNITDGAVAQSDGQITALPGGGYVIAWTDQSRVFQPAGSAVLVRQYNNLGNAVGGELKASVFGVSGDQFEPAITTLSNGNVAVAYTDLFGGDRDTHVRILDANLNPIRADSVNLSNTVNTTEPAITRLNNGAYAVSYSSAPSASTNTDIILSIVSSTGVVGPEIIVNNEPDEQHASQLALLTSGNFVVVFQDQFNGSTTDIDVKYSIFTPAGVALVSSAVVQGAGGTAAETQPQIAALTTGGFVVVWTDSAGDASGQGIRGSIYNQFGQVVFGNLQLNTTSAGNQNEPNVTGLPDGGFFVEWEDDAANVVRGQRFDSTGNKVGAEVVLKNGVANDSPDVTTLTDGRVAHVFGDVSSGDADVATSIWDTRTTVLNHITGINLFGSNTADYFNIQSTALGHCRYCK